MPARCPWLPVAAWVQASETCLPMPLCQVGRGCSNGLLKDHSCRPKSSPLPFGAIGISKQGLLFVAIGCHLDGISIRRRTFFFSHHRLGQWCVIPFSWQWPGVGQPLGGGRSLSGGMQTWGNCPRQTACGERTDGRDRTVEASLL